VRFKPISVFALFAVLFVVSLQTAPAQVLYGSVVGLVEDPSGAAVPNVQLTLTNKATGQVYNETSDGAGRYSIVNVLPGSYDLKAAANGFKTSTRTDVSVTANEVTRVPFRLEVGALSEQVTVAADATQLQTDKADTHSTLTAQQVEGIPLPGYRNYQSLINLVPGATPAYYQNSATDTPNRALSTNVNGTNRNNNVTRIDGAASINIWLPHHAGYVAPAETIETVNITTSAADAEQGMTGGSAVTVVTKSGTNELHGSVFEFHDNQHLRARNYFQAAGVNKPLSIYNNYGGTVGGPIVKNKLFYFFSFDGTRQRQGAVGRWSVPTADIRQGDFSAYGGVANGACGSGTCIYDPLTGNPDGTARTPFPGNKIPLNRISSQAQKVNAFYPAANLAGGQNNYFASGVPKFNRDYIDVKMNWNRNDRHQIWGKYGHMSALVGGTPIFGQGGGPAPGADPGLGDTKIHNGSLGHTYTFSPTLLLDGTIGYQRQDQNVKGSDYGTDFGAQLGIPGLNGPDIRQSGFPNIDNGFTTTGVPGWMPLFRVEETYTTSHNLTWTKGAHEIRMGFDGLLLKLNHWQPELGAGPRGYINFDGTITALKGGANPNYLNSYAAFLLGMPYQYQKSLQYIIMTGNEWQFGTYVRDRWQVNRKLTVNLGLRYEYYPLMTRSAGKGLEWLDINTNQVYLGGRGNVPRDNGMSVSKKMFAPRLGIAYRLDDKTVIRTGYGLSYDPLPFSRPLRGFYPLTVNFNFLSEPYRPFNNISEGLPPVVGPDLSTGIVNLPPVADMRTPYRGEIHRGYIQSWNFTVERKLPADFVVSAGYVGTQSTNMLADLDVNAAAPGGGNAGRPFAAKFGRNIATNVWDGYLSANYHSLQTSINKQFSHGLLIKGAYTWSKAMNMTDDDGWASVSWNWAPVFRRNYAPAGYDRTHVFQAGWVYQLPFGSGRAMLNNKSALAWIAGGWEVDGVFAAYTGTPFTLSSPSGSTVNAPGNSQTPDQVGPVVQLGGVGPGTNWFDPKAFAAPTGVRFGTTGRNVLRRPGIVNTDLSIVKDFAIHERFKVTFRTEMFNAFNHPQWGGAPNGSAMASTDVTNPNFLRILSAFNERQIRFGLRIGF
jgi:hypothetical protein